MNDGKTIEAQFGTFSYPGARAIRRSRCTTSTAVPTSARWSTPTATPACTPRENLEFVVNQSIWIEGEAKFADVILPACTNFERWDIGEFANPGGYAEHAFTQCNHRVAVMQHKCIEPLGEIEVRLPDLPRAGRAPRPGQRLRRGQQRDRVVPAAVRGHRPAAGDVLEEVPAEGLLRGAAAARRSCATRCRTPGSPRTGSKTCPNSARCPATTPRNGSAGCRRRSGRSGVRVVEPQALRPRRPRASAHDDLAGVVGGSAHHRASSTSTRCSSSRRTRASRSTPTTTARAGRSTTSTDHRVLDRRLPLLDRPHQPGRRRGAGHQAARPHPAPQRPRRRHLRRAGHRAGAAGPGALLRVVGGLRPDREARPFRRPGRLREHSSRRAACRSRSRTPRRPTPAWSRWRSGPGMRQGRPEAILILTRSPEPGPNGPGTPLRRPSCSPILK